MTVQCDAGRREVRHGPALSVMSSQDQDQDQDQDPGRSRTTADRRHGGVRSWPLLVLAVPAAAEVWSGWVGIAKMTGFGQVPLLPGIWSALHLDTTVTLPIGVEAYAAYALRAWLAAGPWISTRTRKFARWSAICSFLLGMAGQVAYHLLAQAGQTRAPWAVTTLVSCLPVLALAMGTTLAHMLHDDATADQTTAPPGLSAARSPSWSAYPPGPLPDQAAGEPVPLVPGPPPGTRAASRRDRGPGRKPGDRVPAGQLTTARRIAGELAAAGQPVSRRALRDAGVRGSNQTLNSLARALRAETAHSASAI
jgi:hypothetical protein